MTKFIDSSDIAISNKTPSRLNVFPNKNAEVFYNFIVEIKCHGEKP